MSSSQHKVLTGSVAGLMLAALLLLVFTTVPLPTSAEGINDGFAKIEALRVANAPKAANIPDFIVNVLKAVTLLLAVVALGALIYGGVLYITSGGEDDKTSRAKRIILYAVVGLLVVGAAAVIVNVTVGVF